MIKVYKFGGASVKDADAVKNAVSVIEKFRGNDSLLCVFSAMGKTTNALELALREAIETKGKQFTELEKVKAMHRSIANELFNDFDDEKCKFWIESIEDTFTETHRLLSTELQSDYDYFYDAVVSQGEILSSKLIAAYCTLKGLPVLYKDAREVIKTDNTYREGKPNYQLSLTHAQSKFLPFLESNEHSKIIITQGFIGRSEEGNTVTLGREGSDYSAAIFAWLLNASEVIIWKDVPGVLNADPKFFPDAQLFNHLSYDDTVELAYYGVSVIHPKTLKPLQNKNIPLFVRSFVHPEAAGTRIDGIESMILLPSFIIKQNQTLLSYSSKDFSFLSEEDLGKIFSLIANFKVKVSLMQNSASGLKLCVDHDERKMSGLIPEIQKHFELIVENGLQLITVRNYNDGIVDRLLKNKSVLLEQKNSDTIRLVVKPQ